MNIYQVPIQVQGPYPSPAVVVDNVAVLRAGAGKGREKSAGDLQRCLLNARLHWCQKNRSQTGLRDEKEGWLAEEEGLHDAVLGRERIELIRLCYPSQVERYRLGFQDGQALLRIPLTAMRQHHFYGGAVPRSSSNDKEINR